MVASGPETERWTNSPYGTAPRAAGPLDLRRTDGVLFRRFIAYLIDVVVVAVLVGLLWVGIAILGVITFGLGWMLFGLLPLTAIVYNAVTIGGPAQATIGMRLLGLRVLDAGTGGPVSMAVAAVHALLFYVAAGTLLWFIDIGIGLFRDDSRVGHDLLTGVVLVRWS